jgi:formylglycine-generating enzyme required for sulfatase activity
MVKRVLLWVLLAGTFSHSWSRTDQKKDTIPIAETPPKMLVNVLFATNHDCELYIDNDWKADVLTSGFKYIKLLPGNYVYRAKSRTSPDELEDSFSVAEGKMNEIFMDLLFVVDENAIQREILKQSLQNPVQRLALNDLKANDELVIKKGINKDLLAAIITSLTGNMIKIKGGSFTMGNNKAPIPDEAEHPVTLNTFFLSKYEITQHQWETIMGYNPSFNRDCATCPVENVSWEETMRFIRRLNVLSSKKFRLPTEAEWEYVARIGGKTEIDRAGGQEEYIKKTAWYFSNSEKKPHPVGLKQSNSSGVFDMTGNVSEWCSDWYGTYYYKEDFNQLNPEGPPLGKEKAIRGGNFKDYSGDRFRPSLRNKKNPVEKSGEIGFRLVMDLTE